MINRKEIIKSIDKDIETLKNVKENPFSYNPKDFENIDVFLLIGQKVEDFYFFDYMQKILYQDLHSYIFKEAENYKNYILYVRDKHEYHFANFDYLKIKAKLSEKEVILSAEEKPPIDVFFFYKSNYENMDTLLKDENNYAFTEINEIIEEIKEKINFMKSSKGLFLFKKSKNNEKKLEMKQKSSYMLSLMENISFSLYKETSLLFETFYSYKKDIPYDLFLEKLSKIPEKLEFEKNKQLKEYERYKRKLKKEKEQLKSIKEYVKKRTEDCDKTFKFEYIGLQ